MAQNWNKLGLPNNFNSDSPSTNKGVLCHEGEACNMRAKMDFTTASRMVPRELGNYQQV